MSEQYEQRPLFRAYQCVTPTGVSRATNLDRWMDRKWIIQGPSEVVAWASREEDARVIAQALSDSRDRHG